MTYNEWRDELKSNLLCVSETERRKVLDYYAEAYADRREAGFSEREIIDDFGAPYDAAQRILNENTDEAPIKRQSTPSAPFRQNEPQKESEAQRPQPAPQPEPQPTPQPAPQPAPAEKSYGWLFVLLCIIFCVPLFGIVMGLVGLTIGLCTAPFALVCGGATAIGGSIGLFAGGDIAYGLYSLGGGLIAIGAGIILFPLLFKIIKLIWKLFKNVFAAVKSLFCGKERAL